jgi:hypothetical protein
MKPFLLLLLPGLSRRTRVPGTPSATSSCCCCCCCQVRHGDHACQLPHPLHPPAAAAPAAVAAAAAARSVTENTRASYPIHYIRNARIPCIGSHPRNIILLCCDAFGVLPPVSKLNMDQAMYHFISGYTAKVAGA